MGKAVLSLLVIGGVCGMLLVTTDSLTAPDIKANQEQRARALVAAMLGESLPSTMDMRPETMGDCRDWILQKVRTSGYAGPIEAVLLWRAESGGLVMRVTHHRETPGIGDFIDHTRSPWISQFDNQPLADYVNLNAVSGATITSTAIVRAATTALAQVKDYCSG